jgi:hypothetical protein
MSLVWTVYPLKRPLSVMILHLSQNGALAQTVIGTRSSRKPRAWW